LFSLMHEAVHGMFHGKRSVNEFAGFVAAAFFPTIFPVQRLSHMTHHRTIDPAWSGLTTMSGRLSFPEGRPVYSILTAVLAVHSVFATFMRCLAI